MTQQKFVMLSDLVHDDQVGRLRITIRGAVQGVGFRPCVFRLATEMGLTGWVGNTAQGVIIEIEGCRRPVPGP